MSLRPRYSLLTLLILTALVAGGVKLWYGPHHVVERVEDPWGIKEKEYNYTRDWRGDQVIQGVMVERGFVSGVLVSVTFDYYRQGHGFGGLFSCGFEPEVADPPQPPSFEMIVPARNPIHLFSKLQDHELEEFRHAVHAERERIMPLKLRLVRFHPYRDYDKGYPDVGPNQKSP